MGKNRVGLASRRGRTLGGHSGAWASSSQDFARLANLLSAESAQYARDTDGNCSIYTLAGIPALFSALRCLLIELNAGMLSGAVRGTILEELASRTNDVQVILKHHPIPDELRQDLELLVELRHEIIHPAHRPGPEANNTPAYMVSLRKAGLLQSTGKEIDNMLVTQLQSHTLFRWAFDVISATVAILMKEAQVNLSVADGLIAMYSEALTIDVT